MYSSHNAFSETLRADLANHPVNSNAFFRSFLDNNLTLGQLQVFAGQYHYFCKHFVKLLEGLLFHTPVDEVDMRIELAKTLFSELGEGRRDHAHITLLTRFGQALDVSDGDLADVSPLPSVAAYLDVLRRLFTASGYLAALGAETAVEVTAVSEFRYLYPGLLKYSIFKEDDLAFFKLHMNEEECHSQWLLHAVEKTALSAFDQGVVRTAALETADAWHEFWNGLYPAVFGPSLQGSHRSS